MSSKIGGAGFSTAESHPKLCLLGISPCSLSRLHTSSDYLGPCDVCGTREVTSYLSAEAA